MSIDWQREQDFAVFLRAATEAIEGATLDGARTGRAGKWREQTIAEQIEHIAAHSIAYQSGDVSEDHLTHILCRAAIACALRRLEREET